MWLFDTHIHYERIPAKELTNIPIILHKHTFSPAFFDKNI